MGSVHARGDTFLTFGLKALTETNTSRLATANNTVLFVTNTLSLYSVRTGFDSRSLYRLQLFYFVISLSFS
jgi:hypothetical protein